ncbi:MAG: CBS domain-containing protein [Bacteroidota bacterium]|nr:CBS domain-containing protein [Bacteroidota bacterium]
MLAKELISDVIPALKTSDSGVKALYWMDIFRISHLPIVNNTEFLGLISDTDIYDMNSPDEAIGNHTLSLFSPFIKEDQHVYEAIELISKLKLSVVPVLDQNKNYLGMISAQRLLQYMGDMFSVKNPGGIIVLELNANDYSLTQIAQIVESNDAKILSMYITSPPDSIKIELTLKINRIDLASILQTFVRFDYNIKAQFSNDDEMESLYSNRFEQFMHFLNI